MGMLSHRGRAIVALTLPLILSHVGQRSKRGFNELIWELPTLGLSHPSFWLEPAMGRVIESVWALAWGHLITQCAMPSGGISSRPLILLSWPSWVDFLQP
jgi:hypothetical protein